MTHINHPVWGLVPLGWLPAHTPAASSSSGLTLGDTGGVPFERRATHAYNSQGHTYMLGGRGGLQCPVCVWLTQCPCDGMPTCQRSPADPKRCPGCLPPHDTSPNTMCLLCARRHARIRWQMSNVCLSHNRGQPRVRVVWTPSALQAHNSAWHKGYTPTLAQCHLCLAACLLVFILH